MRASPGDRIIVESSQVGGLRKDGEILEVRGRDGGPPYLVRWSDSGHESLVFPGPDARVHHFEHSEGTAQDGG